MKFYNLVPQTLAGGFARPALLSLLSCVFLFGATAESFAQSSSARPVARLITASRQSEQPQTQYRVAAGSAHASTRSSSIAPNNLERKAFDLINSERSRKGLSPLVWDGELCQVARLHSSNMGRLNFFNHEGPDGTDLLDRISASGIRWKSLGENIAYNQGFDDPAGSAVDQWMHSPKHRSNILRDGFTHSAIGIVSTADGRVYLTQVFITR